MIKSSSCSVVPLLSIYFRACWGFVFGDKKDAFLAQMINSQQALKAGYLLATIGMIYMC